MANFTLRRQEDFTFDLEGDPKTVYTIPASSNLDFKDAQLIANFGSEKTLEKQGELVKEFILKYAPGLAEKGLSDMGYYAIITAYIEHSQAQNGTLGES